MIQRHALETGLAKCQQEHLVQLQHQSILEVDCLIDRNLEGTKLGQYEEVQALFVEGTLEQSSWEQSSTGSSTDGLAEVGPRTVADRRVFGTKHGKVHCIFLVRELDWAVTDTAAIPAGMTAPRSPGLKGEGAGDATVLEADGAAMRDMALRKL